MSQVVEIKTPIIEVQMPRSVPGIGVPSGGTTGQILKKSSGADYAFTWADEGAAIATWEAGQNLFSGRVVVIDGGKAYLFDPNNVNHLGRAYGVTISSASTGANVSVRTSGEVYDVDFVFTADTQLWVWANGEIKNTVGVYPVIQKAGVAVGDKKIIIDLALFVKKDL